MKKVFGSQPYFLVWKLNSNFRLIVNREWHVLIVTIWTAGWVLINYIHSIVLLHEIEKL